MGIGRVLVGHGWKALDPRRSPTERTDNRLRLTNLIAQQLTPDALDAAARTRPGEKLYPKALDALDHRARHTKALIIVGGTARDLPGHDILDLSPSAEPGTIGSAFPDDWNVAQRLLSVVNAGLLEGYEELFISADSAVPVPEMPSSQSQRIAGVVPSLIAASSAELRFVERALRRRHWPTSATVDAFRPASFDFRCRAFLLQCLAALSCDPAAGAAPEPGGFLALLGVLAREAGTEFVTKTPIASPGERVVARIVPFYLPQFHPTPENDSWWGRGFTEWTNVTSARPSFRGHVQPKLPKGLGFYDLRVDEVRRLQAELARHAGVSGFMYYHYWFAGERLLDIPLDRHLADEMLDLPFCIMWANENWVRSWDGDVSALLKAQNYDAVPGRQFLLDALPLLSDRRYMTIEGKKVLSVYRPTSIPDFPAVAREWRELASEHGVELHLLGVEYEDLTGDVLDALDGTMAFPPHQKEYVRIDSSRMLVKRGFTGSLFSYQALVDRDIQKLEDLPPHHVPGVMTGWDNTPRRGLKAHVWVGSNPYTFRRWLLAAIEAVQDRPAEERIVFVNAWNEWAEGAMLEPNTETGNSYLDVVRDLTRA